MNEMDKLEKYLKEHGYDYERHYLSIPGEILNVYDDGKVLWCVQYTIVGNNYNNISYLLQGFGVIFDEPENYLTADEVISRLEAL